MVLVCCGGRAVGSREMDGLLMQAVEGVAVELDPEQVAAVGRFRLRRFLRRADRLLPDLAAPRRVGKLGDSFD